ncbi:pheromone-regulated protein prm10, partial [Coemansia sp. RSA 2322]
LNVDVAAVGHGNDVLSRQTIPAATQPTSMSSRYLQLADANQQRVILEVRPSVSKKKSDGGYFGLLPTSRVAYPEAVRVNQSPQALAPAGQGSPLKTHPRLSLGETDSLHNALSVQPTSSSHIALRRRQNPCPPLKLAPFLDTDLTQFLPYALSTPSARTAVESPALSQTSSIDDWLKHKGQTLDTVSTPTIATTETEVTVLNDKRSNLLEGIRKLLEHQRFLFLMAKAMMQFGAPLHHLEDNLSRMARHLSITATFTTLPGLVMISIEDEATLTSETRLIRGTTGYDMHRLELTDRIFRKVGKHEISVEKATRELNDIVSAPPLFAWYWQLLNWGVISWSVCILAFNGSWQDSLAAFLLGVMIGFLEMVASRVKSFTNLFEVSISILCGFIVTALERWLCFGAVTLSAAFIVLPGLQLTTGVIELASRNMHAGTVRCAYALIVAAIIAFGLNLGSIIFDEMFAKPGSSPDMSMATCSPVSQLWWLLALPVAVASLCMAVNIHIRHWHACIVVAGIMYSVFWVLVMHLGLKLVGPVVSAFVLGLAANTWSRLFKHNAYSVMLPGVLILVPGSVGVRGIMGMFNSTANDSSTQLIALMIQTALSIMTGLFASSLVVYPRGKKQSAHITV